MRQNALRLEFDLAAQAHGYFANRRAADATYRRAAGKRAETA
eukprot:gene42644-38539_t